MSKTLPIDASTDEKLVGNLGHYLARLKKAGFRIVDGFIVPVNTDITDGLSNEILRRFDALNTPSVTLRASPLETNIFSSETIRGVKRDVLISTLDYLQNNSIRRGHKIAVVIQKDINAEFAGTIHAYNPVTMDRDEILIEANLWMNDTVLSGESESDMILIRKSNGAMMLESEEEGEICLTPSQIQELYTLIRKIEKFLGEPVSADWAYHHGVLYILRVRPFTEKTFKRYQ